MMRSSYATQLMAVLTIGLSVSLTDPASAHQGPIVFQIYELPTADLPDLHDGTLEDWDDVLLGASRHAWTTHPTWADVGGFQQGESPNYSAVEFAITPWDDLNWEGPEHSRRSALEAGKIVGFHIDVIDPDDKNWEDWGSFSLAPPVVEGQTQRGDVTLNHYFFAENFVDGELIPCHKGDCGSAPPGGTAVRVDSWGRIKASLR